MSAIPDDQPDDSWDDEWSREDWHELSVVDRGHQNADSWGAWVLRFVGIALALPLVLGILVWLLILAL